MRFVSLYSTQLVVLAVIVGLCGWLLFSQRRLQPGDYDRVLGGSLMTFAVLFLGFVIFANATDPFVR